MSVTPETNVGALDEMLAGVRDAHAKLAAGDAAAASDAARLAGVALTDWVADERRAAASNGTEPQTERVRIYSNAEDLLAALLLAGAYGLELSGRTLADVRAEGVTARSFERECDRLIFAAVETVVDRGEPSLYNAVEAELAQAKQLAAAGGKVYLVDLAKSAPAVENARHYARLVGQEARTRADERLALRMLEAARNGGVGDELRGALAEQLRPTSSVSRPRLRVVAFDEFVAVDEASATPLLGTADENVIAAGSDLNIYGDGGVGKTTLEIDAIVHLAAGVEWLGLAVPRPLRILVIENEGPRGLFRRKLDRRAQTWDGPAFRHNVHVLEEPWAAFSFADAALRHELASAIDSLEIDLAAGGPMSRLGTEGGGTLDEVRVFETHLAALRSELDRPVALLFVHHENNAGEISGAWERAFDTILRLRPDGRQRSRLRWQKARWASTLHGHTWTLAWTNGDTYTVVDRGDTPAADERAAEDEAALAWISEHVATEHASGAAGIARGKVEIAYTQAHPEKGSRARARRVIDRQLELATRHLDGNPDGEDAPHLATTLGERANGTYLIPFNHAPSPLATAPNGEHGENTDAAPLEDDARQLAAAYREGGERRADGEGAE